MTRTWVAPLRLVASGQAPPRGVVPAPACVSSAETKEPRVATRLSYKRSAKGAEPWATER